MLFCEYLLINFLYLIRYFVIQTHSEWTILVNRLNCSIISAKPNHVLVPSLHSDWISFGSAVELWVLFLKQKLKKKCLKSNGSKLLYTKSKQHCTLFDDNENHMNKQYTPVIILVEYAESLYWACLDMLPMLGNQWIICELAQRGAAGIAGSFLS